jgi:hypothetical protein
MPVLLRDGEIAESNAKRQTFTPAELAEELDVERRFLIGGITRNPEYDQHAADAFGALADAGVDAPVVRDLVEQFESFSVSNVGRPLDDGQIEVMRQRFEPRLGKALTDQIAT